MRIGIGLISLPPLQKKEKNIMMDVNICSQKDCRKESCVHRLQGRSARRDAEEAC